MNDYNNLIETLNKTIEYYKENGRYLNDSEISILLGKAANAISELLQIHQIDMAQLVTYRRQIDFLMEA